MNKVRFVCLVSIVCLLTMYIYGLDKNLMNYDEGAVYLYQNMLVSMGKIPYKDFYYHQMPGMLFGFNDVLSARLFTLFCLMVAVVGTYLLGRRFGVGMFAAVFLLSCPIVMQFGRVFMGDIPLLAIFVFFLNICLSEHKGAPKILMMGICLVDCILIKLYIIIPIAVLMLYMYLVKGDYDYIYAGFVGAFMFAAIALFAPEMINQAIIGNLGGYSAERALVYAATSVGIFLIKVSFMLPFFALGCYDLLVKNKRKNSDFMFAILFSAAVFASIYSWLNFNHLMFVLPMMSIIAGIGLKSLKNEILSMAVILVCILVPMVVWNDTLHDSGTMNLVGMITTNTVSNDTIYTDQAMLAFLSKRQMPESALLMNGMGRAHGLNYTTVINDINRSDPKIILLVVNTPDNMDGPRIYSTLGNNGAESVMNYLDVNYAYVHTYVRDWQTIKVWSKEDLK